MHQGITACVICYITSVLTCPAGLLCYVVADRFNWIPFEAERRFLACMEVTQGRWTSSDSAGSERSGRRGRVSPVRLRRVCEAFSMKAYQLRRIVQRQKDWDKFLRCLGQDPRLRTNPEAIKDALLARIRLRRDIPAGAEDELARYVKMVVGINRPCSFEYGRLPRRLRMLGQLELRRAPRNPNRKVTPELAARIKELAGQTPKPSLRRIEQQLRQKGFAISYATVRRVLRAGRQARTAYGKALREGEVRARSDVIN